MNTERWRRVSPHLDRLLDLPEEEREAELAVLAGEDPELVAELAKLLGETRALRAEKFLEHDAFDLLSDSPLEGMELGAYTLDRPLGSGGMRCRYPSARPRSAPSPTGKRASRA